MIPRAWLARLLIAVLLVGLGWWLGSSPTREATEAREPASVSAPSAGAPATADTETRTSRVATDLTRLPPEVADVLSLIDRGGPFAYAKDGTVFQNREGHLPKKPRGYYREYTVPTPDAGNRGARRLVAGADGEVYYSGDHYRSFKRLRP
jgi:ribonuclease T1